jgi:hypothetical protein
MFFIFDSDIHLRLHICFHLCSILHEENFFFSGEGPRSRRYGRTAALRLIVQPYDEDDDYFLSFS